MAITYETAYSERWNSYLKANALDGGLLQSWQWSRFQESLGRKVWRIAMPKNSYDLEEPPTSSPPFKEGGDRGGRIEGIALVIKQNLPFAKSYLYSPRGPIIPYEKKPPISSPPSKRGEIEGGEKLSFLLEEIKKIARKEKAVFWRIDPPWMEEEKTREMLLSLGFAKSLKEVQPKSTLILDIIKTEEELLKQMKTKTRYNIRLAEKKGVVIKIQNSKFKIQNSSEIFWELLQKTAKRDGFRTHPKIYYQRMLEVLGMWNAEGGVQSVESGVRNAESGMMKLFLAKKDSRVIAAILVSFFGKFATYLHGGSDYQEHSLMAPYLLHWQAIKEAKKQQCQYYDFWGINKDPSKERENKWEGLSRFKRGFAPSTPIIEYIGAWDYVFEPKWYRMYQWARKLKN